MRGMKRLVRLFVCVAALGYLAAAPARAIVTDFTATRDATIYQNDNNLANGVGYYILVGKGGDAFVKRALLAFNLGAIPPGSVITDVTLTLSSPGGATGTPPQTIGLHKATESWTEGPTDGGSANGNFGGRGAPGVAGDVTWQYRTLSTSYWSTLGGAFVSTASAVTTVPTTIGSYTWSGEGLVADVQSWVDGGQNDGWVMVGNEVDAGLARRFASRENTLAGAIPPRLTVTYTLPAGWGACCALNGACAIASASACAATGGAYQGDGSDCAEVQCPAPQGACCFGPGTCMILSEIECTAQGGRFQEVGLQCSAVFCPILTGACCLSNATCIEVSQADCGLLGGMYRGDEVPCGSVSCNWVLTPFVDALPIPQVAQPTTGQPGGAAHYDINIREFDHQFHRDMPATTKVWGYQNLYPGPTFEATMDQPITVQWHNDLRYTGGSNGLRTSHFLPVDMCLHGPDITQGVPVTTVHLHGAKLFPDSDGNPDLVFAPGEFSSLYHYPNTQRSCTMWYHDHALGITRLNVYMGLAGFYLLRDAAESALNLPSGQNEIPLVIQDRSFNADGSLKYNDTFTDAFFGDFICVNGKVWPSLPVRLGKYRFRIVNGSSTRTYTLSLMGTPVPWHQIGSDLGLLAAPVPLTSLTIMPGERADIVIDFAGLPVNGEVIVTNSAVVPFPSGGGGPEIANVMRFAPTDHPGHTAALPSSLVPVPRTPESEAVVTREFQLRKELDSECGLGVWLINSLMWHDITEFPVLGTTEIWSWINRSALAHPMHIHLVSFQVLDRQNFSVGNQGEIIPNGPRIVPDPNEMGWKDTVRATPNQITRVIARFEGYGGTFPYHCHILDHEDHEMMRQFTAVCPPTNITTQPISATACAGQGHSLSIAATGHNLAYQWRRDNVPVANGGNISGAATPMLSFGSVSMSDAGSYTVLITNPCTETTLSNAATLTVGAPPVVTTQPVGQTVCSGTSAVFSVGSTGATSHQWRKNGVNLSNGGNILGANGPVLTINPAGPADIANYSVLLTNSCGNAASTGVPLLLFISPSIAVQPTPTSVCPGGSATFTVSVTGSNLSLQWRKNGANLVNGGNISGANTGILTINPVSAAEVGTYTMFASTPSCGSATSNGAALTLLGTPTITTQPTNQTVCQNTNATLMVAASGATTYQWQRDGVNVSGGNSPIYTRLMQFPETGAFTCLVGNGTCQVRSAPAFITMIPIPTITTQPAPQARCLGQPASFSVVATDATIYQWRKSGANLTNGGTISGANGPTLTISSIVAGDAASYDVLVYNTTCGPRQSTLAQLTITGSVAITGQPGSPPVCDGSSASFTVTATNATGYQWRRGTTNLVNSGNISGATAATLNINPATLADAASNYNVVVTGSCGSVISSNATLVVNAQPVITQHPVSTAVCVGADVVLSATATNSGGFQWRKNGVNFGPVTNLLILNNIQLTDAGNYDAIALNFGCTATTNIATVSVSSGSTISTHPSPVTVCSGASASFSIVASNATAYQWKKGGVNVSGPQFSGATTATLTINPAATGDNGNYSCAVTAPCGVFTSNSAALTVNATPVFTLHPQSESRCAGQGLVITCGISPGGFPIFQWRKNGVNLPGATQPQIVISSFQASNAGIYDCVVCNATCCVTSNPATMALLTPPTIITQPVSQGLCSGQPLTLSVAAAGAGPFQYQWMLGGFPVSGGSGATTAVFTNNTPQAGNYTCVVTGACGSVTSAVAVVTAYPSAFLITQQPGTQSVCVGVSASFTVVTSPPAIAFQWRKNGVNIVNGGNISGANAATLTINPVTINDAANYSVVASNPCFSVTSADGRLRVDGASIVTQPTAHSATPGTPTSFTVSAVNVSTYQWRHAGVPLSNGGRISGAAGAALTINPVVVADRGLYDCVLTNLSCGSVTTVPAYLAVGCIADVDDGTGSGTPDGGVTIDDLLFYLGIFDQGDIRSDVDDGSATGTPDGGVTIDDLLYYLARFDSGC